jgi:MHS family proline/betaine transporter-like MFS transporter
MSDRPSTTRVIGAGVIGNMLEWYDFAIYGFFAAEIGRTFFPSQDPVSQVLSAFGIFAVGYLMRPLGGAVLGYLGDRFGRPAALTISVAAMAVPTFLVGILPGYQTLGLAAPIILTALRMLQGLSVGGECPTSMVFLYEHAPPGRRGLVTALAFVGNCSGMLLGSATGSLIATLMTPDDLERWGWRIPFLFGLLVGGVGYLLRREVREARVAPRAASSPIVEAWRNHRPLLFWMAGLSVFTAVSFYLMFLYVVSWLQLVDGIAPAHALAINTASMGGLLVTIVLTGLLSDKVDRRALLAISLVLGLVGAYPLLRLMHHPDLLLVGLGQAGFVVILGLYIGAIGATLVESAPPHVRCSAVGLGFNVTLGLVGGVTPLAATWLVNRTADDLSPAWMIMASAAVSLLALRLYRPPATAPG